MKKVKVLFGLFFFLFFSLAGAQSSYLVKIEQIDQLTIDKIKDTGIEIYAKLADFWVGGAQQKDLDFLKSNGVSFHILDKEAGSGEYYLIQLKPSEEIESQLSRIGEISLVLNVDKRVTLVKGDPGKIEKLVQSGYSVRRIQQKPLPLESKTNLFSYLESLSLGYNPVIASIVEKVEQEQLLCWINDLSGEDTTTIYGEVDSIKTRYTFSQGVYKAADYLKERFENMGLEVVFDTFNTPGEGTYLNDVVCSFDGQKAWAVNYWGGIIMTTDGGEEWTQVEGTGNLYLWDIFKVDDDVLWSVGDLGAIVRSTDGGESWENRSKPEFLDFLFRGCYFEDESTGWVVGQEGMILFTTDGGTGWIQQEKVVDQYLYGVDFTDSNHGWAVGGAGTIIHTTDRGSNWIEQSSGTSYMSFWCVDFVDSLNGWAVGIEGWAVYTTDGGENWIKRDFPASPSFRSVNFVDNLHGWIGGFDGSVFFTSDLGENWVEQTSNTNRICGIYFTDTLTGWAVGYYRIVKTTDGGENWFRQWENVIHHLNVVAEIQGWDYPDREFLITGHYDAITYEDPVNYAPGADDNGSGAVSLLASASILKDYYLSNTVKFVAFTGEEQGLWGSADYAEKAYHRGDNILGVLNFDMIAYDGNGDGKLGVHCGSPSGNQALANVFISTISDYGLELVPQKIVSGASSASDHASFWDWGFPAIMGIEDFGDFNPYYHSSGDRVFAFNVPYYVDFTKAAVASISILGDPFRIGDPNGDGYVDLSDVIFLANYFLKGGPAPQPFITGDVDCDEDVDLGDVIYLANFYLKGGPPPCSP